jgi:hypothetical protein
MPFQEKRVHQETVCPLEEVCCPFNAIGVCPKCPKSFKRKDMHTHINAMAQSARKVVNKLHKKVKKVLKACKVLRVMAESGTKDSCDDNSSESDEGEMQSCSHVKKSCW